MKEVDGLLLGCEWFRIYDFVELFHVKLRRSTVGRSTSDIRRSLEFAQARANRFEVRLNAYFMEHGIGWQMSEGKIVHRGSDAFETATRSAVESLEKTGQQTAKGEIEEALRDISRRPEPDVTGAITHVMAALECVAREVSGKPKLTLGRLVPLLNLTPPMDKAVDALWGFSSERARHIREGQSVSTEEAETRRARRVCDLCVPVSRC